MNRKVKAAFFNFVVQTTKNRSVQDDSDCAIDYIYVLREDTVMMNKYQIYYEEETKLYESNEEVERKLNNINFDESTIVYDEKILYDD